VCVGVPGELVARVPDHPDQALVDVSGVRRRVNIGLLIDEDLRLGDWVLVGAGFALSRISQTEALAVLDTLTGSGSASESVEDGDGLRGSSVI
jgi:hydrogenase expression/formation protein HypC